MAYAQSSKRGRSKRSTGVALVGVLGLTLGLGVSAQSAVDAELVSNGDFESGIQGWTAEMGGVLAVSEDGFENSTSSLAITGRTTTQSSPFYNISGSIKEGDELRLTANIKYDEGDDTKVFNFTLCPDNYDGEVCKVIDSETLTKGEWSSFDVHFTADTDEWDWLFFENPWQASPTAADIPDFKIDNVSLTLFDGYSSILPDGQFESGFDGWTTDASDVGREVGGTLSLDENNSFEGSNSLLISGRQNTFSGPHARLTTEIEAGATYMLNAALMYDSGPDTQVFNFTLCDEVFSGEGCENVQQITANQGEWAQFNTTWVAPDTGYEWALFEVPWKAPGDASADDLVDFRIDSVSLVKIDDSPEEEPEVPQRRAVEDVLVKEIGDHNPINPWKYGADPHGLEWNGRLYVYATNDHQDYVDREKDEFGYPVSDGQYNVTTLNVQSTSDMVNWVDHGEVPVAGPEGVASWSGRSWAPASIARDVENPETGEVESKVFLYFCNGAAGTAVLVGDSPLGPWRDARSEAGYTGNDRMLISQGNPIQFPDGMWLFDPEIFIDDDGQAYLYFGGNTIGDDPVNHPRSTAVVKLRDNMYEVACGGEGEESCEDAIKFIDAPGMFEASSMVKHDGMYYYSYSANFQVQPVDGLYPTPGSIPYMVTDDPMNLQPEHYEGVVFENPNSFFNDAGGNNHADMVKYKDRAYFLYHARTLGKAWQEGTDTTHPVWGNLRNTHVEEMFFAEDGSIVPVEGKRSGLEQIENFDPYRKIEAQTFAWQQGTYFEIVEGAESAVFPEHNNGGNLLLTSIEDGDWTGISSVDFGAGGAGTFTAHVLPQTEGGSIEVRLGDPHTGTVVATLPVDGEIGEWAELSTDVSGATGVHDVFFVFNGDVPQTVLFDADYWEFEPAADAPNAFTGALGASSVVAGGDVRVSGTGAIGEVTAAMANSTVGSGASDDDGDYTFLFTVPADTVPGAYVVTVADESGATWTGSLDVTAADGEPVDGQVDVTGTTVVGETLSASVADWPADTEFTYQWLVSDDADPSNAIEIDGENGSSLLLVDEDEGKWVGVSVTAEHPDFGSARVVVSSLVGPVEGVTDDGGPDDGQDGDGDGDQDNGQDQGGNGDLPQTGASIGIWTVAAVLLVGAGAALTAIRRGRLSLN